MRMECLGTGEVYSYCKLYEEASSPLKYPKKWRNSNSYIYRVWSFPENKWIISKNWNFFKEIIYFLIRFIFDSRNS